jgi:hypothetical protein
MVMPHTHRERERERVCVCVYVCGQIAYRHDAVREGCDDDVNEVERVNEMKCHPMSCLPISTIACYLSPVSLLCVSLSVSLIALCH